MPEVLTCPSCQRKLQVPETLLGQDVQCPTCGATFQAQTGGNSVPASSSSSAPSRSLDRPSKRDRVSEEDYDDFDSRRGGKVRRRRRQDYEPHRGPMIMTMGIISLFFAQLILGPITWILANNDLAAIR